jgi:GTPase SAR1 family protein
MAVSKKICMLGDFAVGNTSLVRRYVLCEFSPVYHATLGVNIYKHTDAIGTVGRADREPVQLNQILWDIEGFQQRIDLLQTYIHGASGAIVVGDVTRDDTVESMTRHARFFLEQRPGRPVVLALNKADLLADPGAGDPETADALAARFGGRPIVTSALDGTAVPDLFRALGQRILELGT